MRRMHPLKLCGFAMLGLAFGFHPAAAQDKTFELKLSHWVPPSAVRSLRARSCKWT